MARGVGKAVGIRGCPLATCLIDVARSQVLDVLVAESEHAARSVEFAEASLCCASVVAGMCQYSVGRNTATSLTCLRSCADVAVVVLGDVAAEQGTERN